MGNIVELVLSGALNSLTCNYVWIKMMGLKLKTLSWKKLFSFIITALSLFFNYYFNNNYIKVACITVIFIIVIRLFFNKNLKDAIVAGIMTEILFIIAESIFAVSMLIIFSDNINIMMEKYFGAFSTNLFICIISCLICLSKIPNKIYKLVIRFVNKLKLSNIIWLVGILIIGFNLVLAFIYYKVSPITILIVNTILVIIYSYIIFRFIKEKNRYIEISDKHSLTESSLKEMQSNINRLMTINHENKNQLKTIRTMVENKDKNILKTLDIMIDEKVKKDKELKEKTSVLANTMLGALIYSKMLTMKENDIHHDLHMDRSITKLEFINLEEETNIDICKIVGVYLDNAIEATLETDEKDISIQIYLEDGEMIICIANTFIGDVDLNAIFEYGYTTKSDGHGFGLSLVKEILKENRDLCSETEISNNIFIQRLKIKM